MAIVADPVARRPFVAEGEPVVSPRREWRAPNGRVVLLAVLAISVAWVGVRLGRGWMPFDEGTLAQTAERLIQGQLPHRDFDDMYTGGLAWLNAAAFELFGTNLWSMRLVLMAAFVAWVPAVWYVARRFVSPVVAGAVTLAAVVWSVPNYTAAMPSWYNLFLATFGLAAVLRFVEAGGRRWLVGAGVAGGLSCLVKISGLFYIAGVLLFLVFLAQEMARDAAHADAGDAPSRSTAYAAFVTLSLTGFVAALGMLVARQPGLGEVVQFVLPGAAIAALLARNEWRQSAGGSAERFRALATLLAPFLVGVALPVALFLVPYLRSGAMGALVNGVIVLPSRRFGIAISLVPSLGTMLTIVPLALLVPLAASVRGRSARVAGVLTASALVALLVGTAYSDALYQRVWDSARMLLPALVLAGVVALARNRAAHAADPLLRRRAMACLAVAALCSLIQFPYFVPNYFCYVAPLVLLSAVATLRYRPPVTPWVPASVLVFYILFAALRMNDGTLYDMGIVYKPYLRTMPLGLQRGGLDVPIVHAEAYRALVPLIRSHARGEYIWASPDCPEIYFLSGYRNPTRSLFDFFDDTTGRSARILRILEARDITLIVLNAAAAFSPPPPDALVAELERRYPYARNVGPFHVRWHS